MEYTQELKRLKELTDVRLSEYFPGDGLNEAMRYSLMVGGKRLRPVLCMKFCEAAGAEPENALTFACAVEMMHTYSLIHDDLPCMDNDDLRRGKPTCHKKFGECTAVLAGDALQCAAFDTVLNAELPDGGMAVLRAARELSLAAGHLGMCDGQYWDTVENGVVHSSARLTEINAKKTGAILRCAAVMGVAAASAYTDVDESLYAAAAGYAENLGLAFQIRDDILDFVSTTQELGKPAGSDVENKKSTFVSVLGVEEAEKVVLFYTEKAKSSLKDANWKKDTSFLIKFADSLAERKY